MSNKQAQARLQVQKDILKEKLEDITFLSVKQRKEVAALHDRMVRESLKEFTHIKKLGHFDYNHSHSKKGNWQHPNPFLWSYLSSSGDPNEEWLRPMRESTTFGGSAWDGMLGLQHFDHPDNPWPTVTTEEFSQFLRFIEFPEDSPKLETTDYQHYHLFTSMKADVNPGPTFLKAGIKSKGDAYRISGSWLQDLLAGELLVGDIPDVYFGMGGRGKPTTHESILKKTRERSPVGRTVWMADAHEGCFSKRYSTALNEHFALHESVIDVGRSMHGPRRKEEIKGILSTRGIFIGGDWDKFDTAVGRKAITFAFDVIRFMFGIERTTTLYEYKTRDDGVLAFLEKNVKYSHVVGPDGQTYLVSTGIPSGSGLTSLLDSIVNAYLLWKINKIWNEGAREDEKLTYHALRVLGDDNLNAFHCRLSLRKRYRLAKRYVAFIAEQGRMLAGWSLSTSKTRLSIDPFVKYSAPDLPHGTMDHSRWHMKQNPYQHTTPRGTRVDESKRWKVFREWSDCEAYIIGRTKRWQYFFRGSVRYCSTHYLPDGSCIRPKGEILSRLASTPSAILTTEEWRVVVAQYYVEFYHNAAARAELLSMFLDSLYMEEDGITSRDDATLDIVTKLHEKNWNEARRYIAEHPYDREENLLSCRGWWLAQPNWYPDARDGRFARFLPYVGALFQAAFRVHGSDHLDRAALYNLRAVHTNPRFASGWHPSYDHGRSIRAFERLFDVIRGRPLERYRPVVVNPWDVEAWHRRQAHHMLCSVMLKPPRPFHGPKRRRIHVALQSFTWHPGELNTDTVVGVTVTL